ncbi:hypothetical protein HDU98_010539 [Podochytrium sp. JEL0797]|nr:hypothetical protein HDU98_010539 [Podochytrium sp. JEL0797]
MLEKDDEIWMLRTEVETLDNLVSGLTAKLSQRQPLQQPSRSNGDDELINAQQQGPVEEEQGTPITNEAQSLPEYVPTHEDSNATICAEEIQQIQSSTEELDFLYRQNDNAAAPVNATTAINSSRREASGHLSESVGIFVTPDRSGHHLEEYRPEIGTLQISPGDGKQEGLECHVESHVDKQACVNFNFNKVRDSAFASPMSTGAAGLSSSFLPPPPPVFPTHNLHEPGPRPAANGGYENRLKRPASVEHDAYPEPAQKRRIMPTGRVGDICKNFSMNYPCSVSCDLRHECLICAGDHRVVHCGFLDPRLKTFCTYW